MENNTNTHAQCYPGTILSPMTGAEPSWNPDRWEINKKYNNCYAYAFDDHDADIQSRNAKPVPGDDNSYYTCSGVLEGIYADVGNNIYPIDFECKCQPGYKKIFAAVSTEQDKNDFHFWRQDNDGFWSHKVGAHSANQFDAAGNRILNPEKSDRAFPSHNYAYGCGFYCVREKSRVV